MSGVVRHLLSRCFHFHLMAPMKHEMKYFPFPIGCRVALIPMPAQKCLGSWMLIWLLVLSDVRLYPCFSTCSFHHLTLLRKKKKKTNLALLYVFVLTKQTSMVGQRWLPQTQGLSTSFLQALPEVCVPTPPSLSSSPGPLLQFLGPQSLGPLHPGSRGWSEIRRSGSFFFALPISSELCKLFSGRKSREGSPFPNSGFGCSLQPRVPLEVSLFVSACPVSAAPADCSP